MGLRMRWQALAAALVLAAGWAAALAQSIPEFKSEVIAKGAAIYSQNCAPCHGARMADPQAAFDLRKFPADEKSRFVQSVTKGKNNMPPWGDVLGADEVQALWAYVMVGEI